MNAAQIGGGARRPAFEGSCQEYLALVLPNLLRTQVPALAGRQPVLQILVTDQKDVEYVYAFGRDGVEVNRGHSSQAELTLAFYADELLDFANGRLDLDRALRERRLQVFGDLELLNVLASALQA
jgi:predicted lipid carrier protein YhbT